jgi:glycosyltransferase involved in cell wall biosynthesis
LLIADGLPAEKLIVIENGIDERWLAQDNTGETWRSQYNIDPDTVIILFLGSFQPYHRVDLLVRAFARLRTSQACHLLLVGEGHTAPDCRVLTRELGISSRVTFAGQVPYSKVPTIIAAGDIAVMPATNQYGNPMKIYEYMAMGKPVIAPNQPTITEVIAHDCGAYLFEPNSEDALREALQIFVDDPVRRLETGNQAYSLSTHHTWTKRAEQLATAIERL